MTPKFTDELWKFYNFLDDELRRLIVAQMVVLKILRDCGNKPLPKSLLKELEDFENLEDTRKVKKGDEVKQ